MEEVGGVGEMKKFKITEIYSDMAFFRKVSIIEAEDEESAQEEYLSGADCEQISDEMYGQDHDPHYSEIEDVEELNWTYI